MPTILCNNSVYKQYSPGKGAGSSETENFSIRNSNKRRRDNSTSSNVNKSRFSPLVTLNDDNEDMNLITPSDVEDHQPTEVIHKIPPIYVHNTSEFEHFYN